MSIIEEIVLELREMIEDEGVLIHESGDLIVFYIDAEHIHHFAEICSFECDEESIADAKKLIEILNKYRT
jgi:hypothetical protein